MPKIFARCTAAAIVIVLMLTLFPLTLTQAAVPPPSLMLSEVQTGGLNSDGTEDGKQEFIELHNPGAANLDVTDWRIEYLSASHNGTSAPTRLITTLEGEVRAGGYVLLSYEGYLPEADLYFGAGSTAASGLLARGGGHVRIVDNLGRTVDLLGWGSGTIIGQWWRAPEIPAGFSVQRWLPGEEGYTDALAYKAPSLGKSPRGGDLADVGPLPVEPCEGLVITEILPNPDGADTNKEFIELFNPTDKPARLKGCTLRLGVSGKSFAPPDETLDPGVYRAFYDSETGITLPNATAQMLWLVLSGEELGVQYADSLPEDISWAYWEEGWRSTSSPTPGEPNKIIEQSPPVPEAPEATTLTPCSAGKERNPLTGRCRNVVELSGAPEACKAGYTRSPATGRCRKNSVPAVLTPCKPGQERNPETNRCRSVLAATSEPKPCAIGQERNPETNRCRKAPATGGSMAKVEDVHSSSGGFDARWWIAALLVAGAIGYAIYEWRQDIWHMTYRLRQKVRPKPPNKRKNIR